MDYRKVQLAGDHNQRILSGTAISSIDRSHTFTESAFTFGIYSNFSSIVTGNLHAQKTNISAELKIQQSGNEGMKEKKRRNPNVDQCPEKEKVLLCLSPVLLLQTV